MTTQHKTRRVVLATFMGALALAACTAGGNGAGPTPLQGTTTTTGRAPAASSIGGLSGLEQLALGQTTVMANPSVTFAKPTDGRLDGYDFSLLVLGYGRAASVSTDSGAYSAPKDATIVVVEYDLTYLDNTTQLATIDFVVNGQSVSVPNGEYQGQQTAGISVPRGARVELAASSLGLTQEFSLNTGVRLGLAPIVLYRSPAGPSITIPYDTTVALRVVDRSNGFRATDDLTLKSVTLTYFSPVDPTVQPASVNSAYLVVNASEQTASGSPTIGWETALPPSRMRLVLPGGKVIRADPASTYTTSFPENLLEGVYFFDVSGNFTTGDIKITPGTLTAVEGASGSEANPTVVGTATFAVALPPVPKAVPPRTPKKPSTTVTASSPTRPSRTRPSGKRPKGRTVVPRHDLSLPLVALALLLLLALAATVLRRRRRGPFALDANLRRVRSLPALPPVPRLALMAGPTVDEGQQSEASSNGGPEPPTASVAEAATTVADVEPARSAVDESGSVPVISFLGPIQISGCRNHLTKKKVLEMALYLATHRDRRYSAEQLASVLWSPDVTERGRPKSVRTYASELRRAMGVENFPEADTNGYGLSPSVTTDWTRFSELVSSSRSAPEGEKRDGLRSALALVRGEPFGGTDYIWVSDERLVEPIELAVVAAARELVAMCLEAGDIETAWLGVDRGLLVSRDSGLFEDLLRVAAATRDPVAFEKAWKRVVRMIGELPDLVALHEELRQGLRSG
jgi:hypothetical protein